MKKFMILIAAAGLLAGCGARQSAEERRRDSLRAIDSILAVKHDEEMRIAAIEQARQDSLRQDSIAKAESARAAIPTFGEIENSTNRVSLFKSRGFKVAIKKVFNDQLDDYDDYLTATYSAGGVSCTYKTEWDGYKYTINGAPDLLEKFYSEAKASIDAQRRTNPNDAWVQQWKATKAGNTVTCSWPGD